MKKVLFSMIISLIVVLLMPLSAAAQTILVHDYANLLTSDNETQLTAMAQSIHDRYGISVVILTTPELYGQAGQAFADNFYENNHFGENIVLFLVDVGSRQWYISTTGISADLISDRELVAIENKVIPYLSDERYYDAFSRFFDILPKYLASDAGFEINVFLSLAAGAGIAGVILLIMRSTMNSKNAQRNAGNYETDGSYHVRTHQDLFLYSNISKQAKPQNNTSGSAVHRSSGGRSHGGRGGKF